MSVLYILTDRRVLAPRRLSIVDQSSQTRAPALSLTAGVAHIEKSGTPRYDCRARCCLIATRLRQQVRLDR